MAEKEQKTNIETEQTVCNDFACPRHGNISLRGRSFYGNVIRKFPKRIVIEFERTVYVQKYERFAKRKTKLHARLPDCMQKDIEMGDYIEIKECRPISKIIHFIVVGKAQREKTENAIENKLKGKKQ
ncbi:30S ribosomal protein S17 [Candidatus Pacearchaeota archaeon]|nr:30S ribosomal protein S17 [Candidatus Pacearchaeota archaeon]